MHLRSAAETPSRVREVTRRLRADMTGVTIRALEVLPVSPSVTKDRMVTSKPLCQNIEGNLTLA